MPEEGAPDEEDRREYHEGNRELLLVRVEAGRDEQPHLRHDDRRREDQAGQRGHLQLQKEILGRAGVDHPHAVLEDSCQRLHDEVEDRCDEPETDHEAYGERPERDHQPRPQFVEVIEEGHLAAGAVIIVILVPAVDGRLAGSGRTGWSRRNGRRRCRDGHGWRGQRGRRCLTRGFRRCRRGEGASRRTLSLHRR